MTVDDGSDYDLTRMIVISSAGSGKTTLARDLADILAVTHVELDMFYWLPEWQPRDREDS